MSVRRVVTGHDRDGRAVFVSDSTLEPITQPLMPGVAFHRLWTAGSPPPVPNDGSPTTESDESPYMPPAGGFRFDVVVIPPAPPDAAASPPPSRTEVAALLARIADTSPWLLAHVNVDPDNPHVHSSDTIDFDVVLSGEVSLELDDGALVDLNPGDTVVLNGTRHRWHNRGPEAAVMAVALIGTERLANQGSGS